MALIVARGEAGRIARGASGGFGRVHGRRVGSACRDEAHRFSSRSHIALWRGLRSRGLTSCNRLHSQFTGFAASVNLIPRGRVRPFLPGPSPWTKPTTDRPGPKPRIFAPSVSATWRVSPRSRRRPSAARSPPRTGSRPRRARGWRRRSPPSATCRTRRRGPCAPRNRAWCWWSCRTSPTPSSRRSCAASRRRCSRPATG